MPLDDKRIAVRNAKFCFNCLNYGYQVSTCKFSHCPKCNRKHNSKLHGDQPVSDELIAHNSIEQSKTQSQTILYAWTTNISKQDDEKMNVMLCTSLVNVFDQYGKKQVCRTVLDSGSQLNFITTDCALRLGLSFQTSPTNITGVGSISASTTNVFTSLFRHIVDILPSVEINQKSFVFPAHLQSVLAALKTQIADLWSSYLRLINKVSLVIQVSWH